MTTNKPDIGAISARLYELNAAKERADQAMADAINGLYPVGTSLMVRHGRGKAVVKVMFPTMAGGSRANTIRCQHEGGRRQYRRDVYFYDVLEVLDDNQ